MFKKLLFSLFFALPLIWASAQNNVGIGTTNPVSKLDVRGNGIGYDLLNVSNDKSAPLDSILVLSDKGYMGLGTTIVGNYRLVAEGRPSAFSPQIEIWQGNPNSPAAFMLGDINDLGAPPNNGVLNLYFNNGKTMILPAQGPSYLNGGNVGIGIGVGAVVPNESLHLGGALVLGQTTASTPLAGTIHWSGAGGNFMGYDGTTWKALDIQQDGDWAIIPGVAGAPVLYTIAPCPAAVAAAGYVPGIPLNQYAHLFVSNVGPPPPGILGHQILMEDASGNLNSSQGFMISNYLGSGQNITFSQGLFNADLSFKICNGPVLTATAQSDNITMARFSFNGIVDLSNQSRVRAYQADMSGAINQLIPPGAWTPVNFNQVQPLPMGYDEHNEFTPAPSVNTAVPPEQAFFTAIQAGYYQVNARCEFNTENYEPDDLYPGYPGGPVMVNADSYVSIAIYTGPGPGQTSMYAQGNNLQIGYQYTYQLYQPLSIPGPPYYLFELLVMSEIAQLKNNNAPNVSDVVYLNQGEVISIWVFHTAATPMNLIQGAHKLYVSIHKVS